MADQLATWVLLKNVNGGIGIGSPDNKTPTYAEIIATNAITVSGATYTSNQLVKLAHCSKKIPANNCYITLSGYCSSETRGTMNASCSRALSGVSCTIYFKFYDTNGDQGGGSLTVSAGSSSGSVTFTYPGGGSAIGRSFPEIEVNNYSPQSDNLGQIIVN